MSNKLKLLTVLLLAGMAAIAVAGAADDKPLTGVDAPFVVVTIGPRGGESERDSAVLERPKVRTLGDRQFLVGKCPDLGADYSFWNGRVRWVALSDVTSIVEFESMTAATKEYGKLKPEK